MGKLRELQKKLRRVTEAKQNRELLRIINGFKEVIIDANLEQLMQGKDSEGLPLDPPYASRHYAEFKLTLNPAGVVDLKLTGAFHDKFVLRATRFPVKITSLDKKTAELINRYGENIFGLQEKNLRDFNQGYLQEAIARYYRELLFQV